MPLQREEPTYQFWSIIQHLQVFNIAFESQLIAWLFPHGSRIPPIRAGVHLPAVTTVHETVGGSCFVNLRQAEYVKVSSLVLLPKPPAATLHPAGSLPRET